MILVLVVTLFVYSDCTGLNAVSDIYKGYRDELDNFKNVGEYAIKHYEQKDYINNDNKDDGKNIGYNNNERDYIQQNKKDERLYPEDFKERDSVQMYQSQKGNTGYKNRNRDKDLNDDKNKERSNKDNLREYYGETKFEKYDAPKDYVVSDIDDRINNRNFRKFESDTSEYDYVPKCDVNLKDCKDGKDCYDNAKDRAEYDKCRDTYGNEDRYYDENDRYTGDRYRFYTDRDPFGYENDCKDNSKNRDDYDKCQQYYRRCSEYNQRDYRYTYNEQDWKNGRDCDYGQDNLVGLGRNDREDQLIRPCALDDWQCIRKFFAQNSKCKPAYGPIPDPLYLRRNTVYLPFANITLIMTRLRLTGLSSIKVKEFYINKDTKNLVIALDFRNLNTTSPRTYFRYKRTAKESVVLSDYLTVVYNSGTFTAVIPKIPHLRLDLAEVHADLDDLIPRFVIGPKASNSKDPDVIAGFARLLSNIPVATQEFYLLQAQLYTAIYIQENICDFGLKLISI